MYLFGLTGGIATGKSTVAAQLRHMHDIPVVDADIAARAVVEPGTSGLAAIVEAFGSGVLLANGQLDRAAMRARISADPSARATLEQITHPRIRGWLIERLQELMANGCPVAGVEAALLVETGGHEMYPELVVVTCSPETQLKRLIARDGMSREQAQALIEAQLPLADKEAVADVVVRNDGSHTDLDAAVADLARGLRERAAAQ